MNIHININLYSLFKCINNIQTIIVQIIKTCYLRSLNNYVRYEPWPYIIVNLYKRI